MRNKPDVAVTTAKRPDSHSQIGSISAAFGLLSRTTAGGQISRCGWMQPMYIRSVSFWGKFSSGSILVPRAHDPSGTVARENSDRTRFSEYSFRILNQSDLPDLLGSP